MLTEYLYVDRARLDSYFEQIGDPVKYDKVPVWKTSFGLTGPSAEATQNRLARPFTLHEKATILHEFLQKHEMVMNGREGLHTSHGGGTHTESSTIRFETMSAQRVLVRAPESAAGRNSFSIWYSPALDEKEEDEGKGPVFLFEDYLGKDDDPTIRWSSYSAIGLLFVSFRNYFERVLGSESTNDLDRTHDDPINLLVEAGATFGPKRVVSVLYRVRAVAMINPSPEKDWTSMTVGYPIFISIRGYHPAIRAKSVFAGFKHWWQMRQGQ